MNPFKIIISSCSGSFRTLLITLTPSLQKIQLDVHQSLPRDWLTVTHVAYSNTYISGDDCCDVTQPHVIPFLERYGVVDVVSASSVSFIAETVSVGNLLLITSQSFHCNRCLTDSCCVTNLFCASNRLLSRLTSSFPILHVYNPAETASNTPKPLEWF